MKTATLKALIWKDFRLSRKVIVYGSMIWAIPYLVRLAIAATSDGEYLAQAVQESFLDGSRTSFKLSFLLIAFLVARVTTAEYTDRSASFLAYLSPSNAAILMSKTICLVVLCVLWPLASYIPAYAASWGVALIDRSEVASAIAIWVLIFGVTWLGGLVTKSAAGAVFCAIITPMAIVWFAIKMHGDASEEIMRQWLFAVAVSVGLICFALGWVFGLRARRMPA